MPESVAALPPGWVTCPDHGHIGTATTLTGRLRLLYDHHTRHHAPTPNVGQLPAVDWRRQALDAIRQLAATGRPFVISQVIHYGVPDPPNPRTDWPRIQADAVALGWIEPTGALGHSIRPTTKGSAVTEWRGTSAARDATWKPTAYPPAPYNAPNSSSAPSTTAAPPKSQHSSRHSTVTASTR